MRQDFKCFCFNWIMSAALSSQQLSVILEVMHYCRMFTIGMKHVPEHFLTIDDNGEEAIVQWSESLVTRGDNFMKYLKNYNKQEVLGVTILNVFDSRLSTPWYRRYTILSSQYADFLNTWKQIYVSYINDIGHRNDYFYMQVLQGSCVGNKQLILQTVAPKWAKFLDFFPLGATNIS